MVRTRRKTGRLTERRVGRGDSWVWTIKSAPFDGARCQSPNKLSLILLELEHVQRHRRIVETKSTDCDGFCYVFVLYLFRSHVAIGAYRYTYICP